jgi:hypothetical protein
MLFFFLTICLYSQENKVTLRGCVVDDSLHTPIPNCSVSIRELHTGAMSDISGNFSLKLIPGSYTLRFNHISYTPVVKQIIIRSDDHEKMLTFSLHAAMHQQDEVTVSAKRMESPSVQDIRPKDLIRIPTIFNDVLRSVTILSGVVTNNEMSSGYNVHGGNFNENLIYLNGCEIYRPFLLQQGNEENQTLINPDMVEDLEFHANSFPVSFGDKMSSALSVNYKKNETDSITGKIRASFLNAGLKLGQKIGSTSISVGARYAYPGFFLNTLQSEGKYHPFFADFQTQLHYAPSPGTDLTLFFLYAKNVHDLTPTDWSGNFQSDRGAQINGLLIKYNGYRNYSFTNSMFALRYSKRISEFLTYNIALSQFNNSESEHEDLNGAYYYIPDSKTPDENREYLKKSYEFHNDNLQTHVTDLNGSISIKNGDQNISSGMFIRLRSVRDGINELTHESGPASLSDAPDSNYSTKFYTPNEYGVYLMDSWRPYVYLTITGGIRETHESMTDEYLFSPRLQIEYELDSKNKLFSGWGYYYQPPYYLEKRNNDVPLISQRAINYSVGWETNFKKTMYLRAELYYRKLDNLIPYYTDGQKIIYRGTNANEGYAYGADVMVQGELVEGIDSRLGYSYLSTKERPKTGGHWVRRLTDQTHTISVFLQDRIKKRSNWQVHTKLNLGSGLLYYDRDVVTDPNTGKQNLSIAFDRPLEFFLYFRVDMGCSTYFTLKNGHKINCTAEVLNMFNQYNYAGYRFVQVFKDISYPVRIPEVLSGRFFNIQIEYEI